jgi:hypothetical protein
LKAFLHKDTRGDIGQNGRREKTTCVVLGRLNTGRDIGVDDHSNEEAQEEDARQAAAREANGDLNVMAKGESISNSNSYILDSPLCMSPRLLRTTYASKQKTYGKRAPLKIQYRMELEDVSKRDPLLAAAIEENTRHALAASSVLAVSKAAALASKKNTDKV